MDFTVGEDLRLIREMLNLAQEKKAAALGVREITIARRESNDQPPL